MPGSPYPRRRVPAPLLLLVATLAACADEPPELEVAGIAFTRDELLGLPADRKVLLGELAALARTVSDGEAADLAEPLVERAELEHLARVARAATALDSAGVGEDVLRARYLTDPELELTVRHLLVFSERFETDERRAEARAKAQRALERIRAGEPFPDVAAEVSEEPGAESREGLLTPGRRGSWVPEFWAAATALEPGGISPVTETQYGFHVLRLEARDTVPFEEVRHRVALDVAELMGAATDPYGTEGPDIQVVDEALRTEGWQTAIDDADPSATTVARWDGGALDLVAFRRYLATLSASEWEAAMGDPAPAARRAARLHAGAAAARALGAEAPGAVGAVVRRDWDQKLARWTYVFGFREDMPADALKAAALEALGATGQGPATARDEVHRYGPLLRVRYPVTLETRDAGTP